MLDERWDELAGPFLPLGAKGVLPFHHAPPVVAAALDEIDHLPQVLADFAGPKALLVVEAEFPDLAMAEGPDFAAGVFGADERIVLGNGILLATFGVIDINPQDRTEEVADVLAGEISISNATAVARG